MLFLAHLLHQVATEAILGFEEEVVGLGGLGLSLRHLGTLQVDLLIELAVQVDRIDDVEHVFPYLEVDHHCDILDVHLQLLNVSIEGQL